MFFKSLSFQLMIFSWLQSLVFTLGNTIVITVENMHLLVNQIVIAQSQESWNKPSPGIWLSTLLMVSANPHHGCYAGQTTLRWCLGMILEATFLGLPPIPCSILFLQSLSVLMKSMKCALTLIRVFSYLLHLFQLSLQRYPK